jgi:hypothetical protein
MSESGSVLLLIWRQRWLCVCVVEMERGWETEIFPLRESTSGRMDALLLGSPGSVTFCELISVSLI